MTDAEDIAALTAAAYRQGALAALEEYHGRLYGHLASGDPRAEHIVIDNLVDDIKCGAWPPPDSGPPEEGV